jgi:hypothetical protein
LSREEKKQIDALMRLPAAKRASAFAKAAGATKEKGAAKTKTKTEAKTAASKAAKPERIALVSSINATLRMLVADARVAAAYQGIRNPTEAGDPHFGGSDWDRLSDALGDKDWAPFEVAGKGALALDLDVHQGQVSVWAIGDRLVLSEGFGDSDDRDDDDRALFQEFLTAPPAHGKNQVQKTVPIDVPSGWLVLMPSTDACDDIAARLARRSGANKRAVKCGSDDAGCMLAVPPGRYELHLEKMVRLSWGTGRRCHIVRSA